MCSAQSRQRKNWPTWALRGHRGQHVSAGRDRAADWMTGRRSVHCGRQSACQRRRWSERHERHSVTMTETCRQLTTHSDNDWQWQWHYWCHNIQQDRAYKISCSYTVSKLVQFSETRCTARVDQSLLISWSTLNSKPECCTESVIHDHGQTFKLPPCSRHISYCYEARRCPR